jgi:hypothetical protein
MDSYRKTAIIVGVLFIIATVSAILTIGILGTTLDPSEYLTDVEANETQVVLAVIFWLILAVSVLGIGVMMYPLLKKYHGGLAQGYVALRLVETICIVISSICLMSLLTMSKEFGAGTMDASYYQPVGSVLLALQDWSFAIGTLIFLGLGGLALYYGLYELQLVPKWLSLWGLIGAACIAFYGLLSLFGLTADSVILNILAAPIAVQEMVFAVYLIVKGFKPQVIKSKSG